MEICTFHLKIHFSLIVSLFVCLLFINPSVNKQPKVNDVPTLELVSPLISERNYKIISGKKCVDIESGSNLHLKCISDKPVRWAFPQNHEDVSRSIFSLVNIHNECERNKRDTVCESNFILSNTSFEQTGLYSCFHNDSEFEATTENADSLYIFVNDEENLLVPVGGNPSIRMLIVETYPTTIPCLPTTSTTNVTLRYADSDSPIQIGDESGTFDATAGFHFSNPRNHGHLSELSLICVATQGSRKQIMLVLAMWSNKPSFAFQPIINDDEAKHVRVNSNFSLDCLVHIEDGAIIKMDWIYPIKNSARVVESKPETEKLDEYIKTVSSRLTVIKAQTTDNGVYTCRVTDATKRTYFARHNITLSTSDEEQHQILNFTVDLNNSELNLNVGEEAKFVVTAHGISDISSLKMNWLKDGQTIVNVTTSKESTGKPVSLQRIRSEIHEANLQILLIINNVLMQDTGNYTLVGRTSENTTEISVKLIVTGKPYVSIENKSLFYIKDKQYSISCFVIAYPEPSMQWLWMPCSPNLTNCHLNNESNLFSVEQGISSNKESISFNVNSNSDADGKYLLPMNLTAREPGIYRCLAENANGTSSKDELFIVSDINEYGFSLNASTDETVENEYLSLTCKVSAFAFTNMSWFIKKENASIEPFTMNSTRIVINNRKTKLTLITELIFNALLQSDNATYICKAISMDNIIRETRSEEYTLMVDRAEPANIVRTNMKGQLITASQSTMNSFRCEVDGKPKPKIVWFKNGRALNATAINGIDLENDGQRLVIRRLVAADSGRYECRVSNRLHSTIRFARLKVHGSESGMSAGAIAGAVFFVVVGVVFVILAIILGKRVREERQKSREIGFITQNLLEHGTFDMYNEDLPLDEQAELLPYEQRYEFPKERLKLGRTLGQGAFGRVVRAEAIGLEEGESSTTVAVKMLKERADFTQMKALVAELKIMIHLGRHLNIVNLLGAVTKNLEKGELMVIVEYCRCGNLREYLLARREYFINQINLETGEVDIKKVHESNQTEESRQNKKKSVECPEYENIPAVEVVSNPGYHMNSNNSSVNDYVNCVVVKYKPSDQSTVFTSETGSTSVSVRSSNRGSVKSSKKSGKKAVATYDLICYGFQVARGMEYLERRKLIHRDLAARNVLLAEDNIVKICDFGLAKDCYKYDEYVKKGDGPLPIKWMAIESIRDKVFTHKSDVWSFGILLWEFFTLGSNPYPGIEVNEEFYKKLKYGYRMEKPDYSPDSVYKIMQACWSDEPNNRPNFTELAEQLGDLLEASVRQHYLDLNDPYQSMNVKRESEYLLMKRQSTQPNNEYMSMDQDEYENMNSIKVNRHPAVAYVNCSTIIESQVSQKIPTIEKSNKQISTIPFHLNNTKLRNSNENVNNDTLNYMSMDDSNSSFPPSYTQAVQ